MIPKNRPKSPVPAAATITLANIFCNVTWVRPAEITWPTPSLWLLIVYSYNNLIMYPTIFFVISVSALFKNPSYVFLIREVYSLHTYTHTHRHTHTHIYVYVCIYVYKYILLLLLLLYWVLYGFYPTYGPQPKPNSIYSKTRIIRGTMKVLRNSEFEEIHFKALLATCKKTMSWVEIISMSCGY